MCMCTIYILTIFTWGWISFHLLRASSVALSALSVACVALSFALSAAISLRRSSLLVAALAAAVKCETK
jgi:hypothetical protein